MGVRFCLSIPGQTRRSGALWTHKKALSVVAFGPMLSIFSSRSHALSHGSAFRLTPGDLFEAGIQFRTATGNRRVHTPDVCPVHTPKCSWAAAFFASAEKGKAPLRTFHVGKSHSEGGSVHAPLQREASPAFFGECKGRMGRGWLGKLKPLPHTQTHGGILKSALRLVSH